MYAHRCQTLEALDVPVRVYFQRCLSTILSRTAHDAARHRDLGRAMYIIDMVTVYAGAPERPLCVVMLVSYLIEAMNEPISRARAQSIITTAREFLTLCKEYSNV